MASPRAGRVDWRHRKGVAAVTPQTFQRARDLFTRACRIPASDRHAWLVHECRTEPDVLAEVQSLLAEHESSEASFLDSPPMAVDLNLARPADILDSEQVIGGYRLMRVINEGGMGVVYQAEQRHPVRRTVALKLIKPGMDSRRVIARFESERQALALMNHPNVARVFDAGTSPSGRPFFVMEYVPGESITRFCDQHQYTIAQRLELFIQACEATQHAHQKAIIHRDLKPSNILVMLQDQKPIVKVIDFGLAKAMAQQLTELTQYTETGQLMGTPEYMSPEQADSNVLDIDTRSDIYSLGAVLYELLSGVLPFDSRTIRTVGIDEVRRIIREVEPPRPSTRLAALPAEAAELARSRKSRVADLVRQLQRELEWIPLKAMRKERAERYTTADQLAEDVRNYLSNLPLVAGPPSAAYRLKKFLRRNKGPLTAAAAVVLALLLGIAATTVALIGQARARAEAEHQRTEAQKQRADAVAANEATQAVNEFLTRDVIRSADPAKTLGRDMTVREALDKAAESIAARFQNQPVIEATVRDSVAGAYQALGRADLALPHATMALELRRRALGDSHEKTLGSMSNLAVLLQDQRRLDEALPLARQAAEGYEHALGTDHTNTLRSMNTLANLLLARGKATEAEALFRSLQSRFSKVEGEDSRDALLAMNNLGCAIRAQNRLDESEALLRTAMDRQRATFGQEDPDTLRSANNLGLNLYLQGRLEDAELLLRQTVQSRRRVLGEAHPETLASTSYLASLLQAAGKLDQAEPFFAELARLAPPSPLGASYIAGYGLCLVRLTRYEQAEQPLRAAYERLRDAGPSEARMMQEVVAGLALVADHAGKPDEAARWRALIDPAGK
jgi:serine/threonine protein kinase